MKYIMNHHLIPNEVKPVINEILNNYLVIPKQMNFLKFILNLSLYEQPKIKPFCRHSTPIKPLKLSFW